MRWLGMTTFPKGPQLWSCPVWTKKIINLSTNPFRLKMRFQKMFAKHSPAPWEQVPWIFPICIRKIIQNIFIYFYERLPLQKASTANQRTPARLCSNPTEQKAAWCFYSLINGCRRLRWLLLGCKEQWWREAFWLRALGSSFCFSSLSSAAGDVQPNTGHCYWMRNVLCFGRGL